MSRHGGSMQPLRNNCSEYLKEWDPNIEAKNLKLGVLMMNVPEVVADTRMPKILVPNMVKRVARDIFLEKATFFKRLISCLVTGNFILPSQNQHD